VLTDKLEQVNKLALRYYLRCFEKSKRAQEYVYARISKATADRFLVGYAPREGFIEYLNKHDVSFKLAYESGLVAFDEDRHAYPRFSNRVMLPIIYAGCLMGFGGRTLGTSSPKYLNSRASLIYNKSEVLYGLNYTRRAIYRLGFCYVVEGYFDVLVPYDHGLKNCVATCGTSLTKTHASILRHYTDKVFVMYDPDEAGIKAAARAKITLKDIEIYAGTVNLPGKRDPASFIEKYKEAGVRRLLRAPI
jgi:DNA primase